MNAASTHTPMFHAMLDGTLDPAGEQAVLDLLASDAAARVEFARLAQLHAWLSSGDALRLAAPLPTASARRLRFPRRAWWLAAAVAAALIILTASRLWPAPESAGAITFRERIEPILTAACIRCHERLDRLVSCDATSRSTLWQRLTGDTPCRHSLTPGDRSRLMEWLATS